MKNIKHCCEGHFSQLPGHAVTLAYVIEQLLEHRAYFACFSPHAVS